MNLTQILTEAATEAFESPHQMDGPLISIPSEKFRSLLRTISDFTKHPEHSLRRTKARLAVDILSMYDVDGYDELQEFFKQD